MSQNNSAAASCSITSIPLIRFSNSLYYQDAFERTQYNDMQSNGRMDSSILSLPSLSFNLYISTTCSYHSSPHPLSLSLSVYLSPPFSFYCSFCSFSHFFLYTFSVNLHLLSLCIRTTKTVRWKQRVSLYVKTDKPEALSLYACIRHAKKDSLEQGSRLSYRTVVSCRSPRRLPRHQLPKPSDTHFIDHDEAAD
ncbi:unnamed protein product [Acanthosepion pharaonis]|uniref:Uncharacterized protein n=1 Tax=Acanthosepion pharaonis TaxID=158019 RepID=A0A812DPV4_ACAPH|nr:unnamed protein product [Sepia pharaonis]